MKKTMSIVGKLRWMAAVSTLILIAVSGYMLLTQYQNSRRDREIAVRQTVEVGHSILAWAHQLETSGSHTREQAQQMAQHRLQEMAESRQFRETGQLPPSPTMPLLEESSTPRT